MGRFAANVDEVVVDVLTVLLQCITVSAAHQTTTDGLRHMTDLLSPQLLKARNVFVSGGSSGINLAIADTCASLGANLLIAGRTEATLKNAVTQLGRHGTKVVYAVADVRDGDAVSAAFEHGVRELGGVDAAICGAAGNFLAPAEAISTKGFKAVMEIDLLGSFHWAKAAFEHVRASHGTILFVSAGQSKTPFAFQAHVTAAKAGVDQLMRALAVEWGGHGIRVNSIVPGPTAGTEGMKRLAQLVGDEVWTSMIPLGRFAELREIAVMAAVLISPIASFVNGAQVVVDGGMMLSGAAPFNQAVGPAVEAAARAAES
jgi:NAD(P)-dependent dehydrogenase (short-subunit alcohol dehydrogenase family)